MSRLENKVEQLCESVTLNFKEMEKRFDRIEKRFDYFEARIDRFDNKIDVNFKWLVGIVITLFLVNGLLPAISKLIH